MFSKKFTFVYLLLFAVAIKSHAQIVIESETTTDSVNLFVAQKTSKAPDFIALSGSLLLPGLGHTYIGNKERAFGYFAAEAVFIGALIFCDRSARGLQKDAQTYAHTWAHTTGGAGADNAFWSLVGKFGSAQEYNRIPEYNRDDKLKKYTEDNLQWNWDSDSLRKEYNYINDRATSYRVVSRIFFTAMLLDRVVAFIDTRYSLNRSIIPKIATSAHLTPTLDIISGEAGLSISTQF